MFFWLFGTFVSLPFSPDLSSGSPARETFFKFITDSNEDNKRSRLKWQSPIGTFNFKLIWSTFSKGERSGNAAIWRVEQVSQIEGPEIGGRFIFPPSGLVFPAVCCSPQRHLAASPRRIRLAGEPASEKGRPLAFSRKGRPAAGEARLAFSRVWGLARLRSLDCNSVPPLWKKKTRNSCAHFPPSSSFSSSSSFDSGHFSFFLLHVHTSQVMLSLRS